LCEFADWLGKVDADLARATVARIRASSWRLRQFPLSAPEIDHSGRRKLIVAGTAYLIVYRLRGGVIEFSRVHHEREDWAAR
jgi:plasmid stabilization system protein ParE